MNVYRTTLNDKDGSKPDTRLILAPTLERAVAKATRLYAKRFYSWTTPTTVSAESLGEAVAAGGPVRV